MFNLLIVAQKGIHNLKASLEARDGIKILETTSEQGTLKLLEEEPPEVIFLEESILFPKGKSSEGEGRRFLRLLKEKNRKVRIAITSDVPSYETAVLVVKWGAEDYFVLPKDTDRLCKFVESSFQSWRKRGSSDSRKRWTFDSIIGESDAIKRVIEMGRRVAESDVSPILIRGETGSGKELIARAIHYSGPKANQPFVEINMTAIPETLLEAELFGHEKGAFTDAKHQKKGMFEVANGGTLFLDEIGHLSLGLQMKLLKVVEDKVFRRLGGTKDIEVNLRIIAATNANLEVAMRRDAFRKDLYFRLNTVSINLPPLRERGMDVILLVRHFLGSLKQGVGSQLDRLSPDMEKSLLQYTWPGNVRELKNGVERAALLGSESLILPQEASLKNLLSEEGGEGSLIIPRKEGSESTESTLYYSEEGGNGEDGHSLMIPKEGITFEEMERRLIEEILNITHWNKSEASRLLKISRPRLLRKIEKYHITRGLHTV
jgi:DNA-binding NtrC family response regulator